jgi:hypothetical protein
MKKICMLCALTLTAFMAFGDSELDMYSYLYDNAQTNSEQLAILQSMAEAKVSGGGDFYAKALGRLVAGYGNVRTGNAIERQAAGEQARLLANSIGIENASAAARDLWRIYTDFPQTDALAKAEALMALGKIQASAYFSQVNEVLLVLNGDGTPPPERDRLNAERVAYGAIIALEKYKDGGAFQQVYNASHGWYSDRIKSQAIKSLGIIADNLAEQLSALIKSPETPYAAKLVALQTVEKSKAPNDAKAAVAVTTLALGWSAVNPVPSQQAILSVLRQTSIDMIKRYGTADASVYPLLERSYNDVSQQAIDERLASVSALATLASDQAAQSLAKFLDNLNTKRQRGNITQIDEQMVRAVIPALGATKQPAGRAALNAVGALDWTPTVKNLARTALSQLPAN